MEKNVKSIIESLLYTVGSEGIEISTIKKAVDLPTEEIHKILKQMQQEFIFNPDRGLLIACFDKTYRLLTKKENHEFISKIFDIKTKNPLSQSLLETLSIIAYNQPCTNSIIEQIRGHNALNSLERLEKMGLIACVGRSSKPGRPYLYEVTQNFFNIFGIKSLKDLPKLSEDLTLDSLDQSIDFFGSNRLFKNESVKKNKKR